MTTVPNALKPPRNRWIASGVAVVLALVALVLALPRLLRRTDAPARPVTDVAIRTVAENEAGTVGDLTVAQEAMDLAGIRVGPSVRRSVREALNVGGVIEAGGDRVAKVTPRVAGKAVRVLAVVGDAVRAGQTLALVESTDLAQAQAAYRQATARRTAAETNLARQRQLARLGAFSGPAVEEARMKAVDAEQLIHDARHHLQTEHAELVEAQSEQDALAAQVEQAQSALALTNTRLARTRALFGEELVSRQEWEQAVAEQKKAETDLTVARAKAAQGTARLASARTQVDAAQSMYELATRRGRIAQQGKSRQERVHQGGFLTSKEIVEAEAEVRRARLEQQAAAESIRLLGGTPGGGSTLAVTSPIAGQVQERTVTLGETVDTEHPLFTVANLQVVWANLQVAPRDLARVRPGMPVELTSEAGGGAFAGKVAFVGTAADAATRAVPVRVALTNPGGALRPGAFVRGKVVTDVRRQQVVIPEGAIQEHTGRKTVYVAVGDQSGMFEVRHIVLGKPAGNGLREVTDGLKGTERIAVSGTFYLKSEALKSMLSDGCCAVEEKK